jgi:sugar-specific transcriptional regulator TrmB
LLSDNEEAVLTNLGLTLSQAKAYFALVKKGPSKASTIAQASKISREHLYPLLNSLEKKGLIEKELGATNIYIAAPLESVLSALIKKGRRRFWN